jgi:uncharacterized protein YkwD
MVVAALPAACVPPQAVSVPAEPPPVSPGQPWGGERQAVVAQINAAREEAGLPALRYDSLLERVGDAHCAILLAEGGDGHFSRSGVPPYLRWLLAGGHGFHVENVGAYSTTAKIGTPQLGGILALSVTGMLDEVPPADGHRRALLDPWVTHIGVGLAWRDGTVRMTHEMATEVTSAWTAPPEVTLPRTKVQLSGRLPKPWVPAAAELLWEELPHTLTDAQLRAIRSYAYPPRRAMVYANRPVSGGATSGPHGGWDVGGPVATPFETDRRGNFWYRWTTGSQDGVEIVLLWGRHGRDGPYVPVAASATVVVETGQLPRDLALWRDLGELPDPRDGGGL